MGGRKASYVLLLSVVYIRKISCCTREPSQVRTLSAVDGNSFLIDGRKVRDTEAPLTSKIFILRLQRTSHPWHFMVVTSAGGCNNYNLCRPLRLSHIIFILNGLMPNGLEMSTDAKWGNCRARVVGVRGKISAFICPQTLLLLLPLRDDDKV